MRRLLSIILSICILLSFTACGDNLDQNNTQTTPPKDSEPVVTTPPDMTVDPNEPTEIPGRQEMWESIFGFGDFRISSNSFEIAKGENHKLLAMSDEQGARLIKINSTLEEGYLICAALVEDKENGSYFYMSETINGEFQEMWYKCEEAEDAITTDDIFLSSENSADVINILNILREENEINYIHSIGDIDYIDVIHADKSNSTQQPSDESFTIVYDASLDIEYNGEKGRVRCSGIHMPSVSPIPFWSIQWETEIPGMDLMQWTFDADNSCLVFRDNPSETITCTMVTDYLNPEPITITFRIAIDSKTLEIQSVSWELDSIETTITFINCASAMSTIKIPENIEETVSLEIVLSRINFAIMTFYLVSSADQH